MCKRANIYCGTLAGGMLYSRAGAELWSSQWRPVPAIGDGFCLHQHRFLLQRIVQRALVPATDIASPKVSLALRTSTVVPNMVPRLVGMHAASTQVAALKFDV